MALQLIHLPYIMPQMAMYFPCKQTATLLGFCLRTQVPQVEPAQLSTLAIPQIIQQLRLMV